MNEFLEGIETGILKYEKIKEASQVTAKAFINSVAYERIFEGDESWRLTELSNMFEINFNIVNNKAPESLQGFYQSGEIVCFYMLVSSGKSSTSLLEMLRFGLIWLPFRIGIAATTRLLSSLSWHEEQEKDIMNGRKEYLVLQRMIVHPDYQGRGIGKKCLSKALKIADKNLLPIYLTTQLEKNVNFYEKLSFRVVRESVFSSTNIQEYNNWFMIREPVSSS